MRTLYKRLRTWPLAARVTRYTLGSAVAATTSAVVFAVAYQLGSGPTTCSILAFVAGAVPNWILNRRWAWQLTGRIAIGREVLAYVAISALSLLASSLTTEWTQDRVQAMHAGHGVRVALVTASYLAVFAVLFVAKFAVYEVWIFSGRSRVRAALRSRRHVWMAARANRMP